MLASWFRFREDRGGMEWRIFVSFWWLGSGFGWVCCFIGVGGSNSKRASQAGSARRGGSSARRTRESCGQRRRRHAQVDDLTWPTRRGPRDGVGPPEICWERAAAASVGAAAVATSRPRLGRLALVLCRWIRACRAGQWKKSVSGPVHALAKVGKNQSQPTAWYSGGT